jgi:hypothetical protein
MTPEHLEIARPAVFIGGAQAGKLTPLALIARCGRMHPNYGVWLWMVRDGLARMIKPTFGEPERFELTQAGINAVLAANAQEPS